MKTSVETAGKYTKVRCEKCGTNYYNRKFYLSLPYGDSEWKNKRSNYCYTRNIYVCYDCFVETFQNMAKDALMAIQKFPPNEIRNIEYIQQLAEMKHERKVFNIKRKEIKHEEKQTRLKEQNSGIDIVGII